MPGHYQNTTRVDKDQSYTYMWKWQCVFTKWVPTNQYLHEHAAEAALGTIQWTQLDLSRFGMIGTEEKCYWGLIAVHWLKPLPVHQELSGPKEAAEEKKEEDKEEEPPKHVPPPVIIMLSNMEKRDDTDDLIDLHGQTTPTFQPKSIAVDAKWTDQEEGEMKAALFLKLFRGDQEIASADIFGTYDRGATAQTRKIFTEADPLVAKAQPGDTYKAFGRVGAGGTHLLHVKTFTAIVKAVAHE